MIVINNCPICNSSGPEKYLETQDYFLTKERFKIYRCPKCAFLFTNLYPELENLSDYYESEEYLSHSGKRKSLKDYLYRWVKGFAIKSKYKKVVETASESHGKILDYGCATGEFLNYCKSKGWKTLGIEPNEQAGNFAADRYGIEVRKGFKEVAEDDFDVLTFWHVLEHIPDLNEVLQFSGKVLKSSGTLVIAVPNINSWDAEHYGAYWAALDVPRHLYHFSEDSMENLLSKNDFKLTRTIPMKFDSYYVSLLSEKYKTGNYNYLSAFLKGCKSNRAARSNGQYSSLIFVAKKK